MYNNDNDMSHNSKQVFTALRGTIKTIAVGWSQNAM